MSAQAHAAMVAAVAPYIDTAISKTVNVPADYPYADFQDLYLTAWRSGLKGLATYRPNAVLGSVLSVDAAPRPRCPSRCTTDGANQRLALERLPAPVLTSLRWPGRPDLPAGNPAWSFMIQHPHRRVRALRRRTAGRGRAGWACSARPALRGLGQRRRAAARPGRAGQDAVDGHARQRPGLAASSSSTRWPPWPRSAPSRCPSRRTARSACSPAWWRPPRR